MELFRSLLFVPGNSQRMLDRAGTTRADVIVIDLEDAVPLKEKKAARRMARAALRTLVAARRTVFVRVNAIDSGLTRDDVLAVVRKELSGVVMPKAEHPQDLRDLDVLLREAEMANRVRPGDIRTIPLVESPRALLRCEDLARASDRIVALSVGGEDYSAAMGIARDAGGLGHVRYVVATVAAAYGIAAIDTPYTDFRDLEGLETETRLVKAIGFKGKYLIHPNQVAVVNRIFVPSPEEIAGARAIVTAAEQAVAVGSGAVALDGRMVDAPVTARARQILDIAAAIRGRSAKK